MTLEISLETRGCSYLRQKNADPVKRGQDGEPDREVLWGRGLHFWIEFKKEKTGRIRPGQKTYAKYLRAIGDEVYFIDNFQHLIDVVELFEFIHGPATANRYKAFNP
jgi:hypothetical protein